MRILQYFLWAAVAVAAAIGLGGIALHRGEHINSLWLVLAAACSYATAFRFYGKFIAARVMALKTEERVMILSAGVGSGHNSAAAALKQACLARDDIEEVLVLDVLQESVNLP